MEKKAREGLSPLLKTDSILSLCVFAPVRPRVEWFSGYGANGGVLKV